MSTSASENSTQWQKSGKLVECPNPDKLTRLTSTIPHGAYLGLVLIVLVTSADVQVRGGAKQALRELFRRIQQGCRLLSSCAETPMFTGTLKTHRYGLLLTNGASLTKS
jgi:hypothetical protein